METDTETEPWGDNFLQQYQLAGVVPELEESLETVGGYFEGVDKDRSNDAGPWDDV